MNATTKNRLYYGDNLHVLRDHVQNESVDLIYLDPPFNSKRDYNLLFKTPKGMESDAQITAFEDSWHWAQQAEDEFKEIVNPSAELRRLRGSNTDVADLMQALRSFLKENDMLAYLTMMCNRLLELHRVLKPTGSLYLHCDPTASHYLKLVLDGVFGKESYQNEIIWKRTTTHSDSKTWSRVADTILFYTKAPKFTWNTPHESHSEEYVADKYRHDDEDGRGMFRLDNMTSPNPRPNMMYVWKGFPFPDKGWRYELETMKRLDSEGRIWYPTHSDGSLDTNRRPQLKRYLDEMKGGVMGTVWSDINPINSQAQERLGYPTQKPLALLERIISASSNEGDVVLDPFCGCGTAVHAAEKLGRRWIGIDITHLSVSLIEKRMKKAFPYLDEKSAKPLPPGGRVPARAGEGGDETNSAPLSANKKSTRIAAPLVQDTTLSPNPSPPGGEELIGNPSKLWEHIGFEVIGTPQDFDAAKDLADRDKYQFQFWACTLVNAQPYKGGKKGADGGVDGIIYAEVGKSKTEKIVVSVKGGANISNGMIRDLKGAMEREKAIMGLFITLTTPTKPMVTEAVAAGHYQSPHHGDFPKIQILTIEGLLSGMERAHYPDMAQGEQTFKAAKTEKGKAKAGQGGLFE